MTRSQLGHLRGEPALHQHAASVADADFDHAWIALQVSRTAKERGACLRAMRFARAEGNRRRRLAREARGRAGVVTC